MPKPPPPKPLTRDNLTLPRTEEGTPIPIIYGRVRVTAPILAWIGPLKSLTLDNANNGAQYIVYSLDMLFVAGIPMGSIKPQGQETNPENPRLYNVWIGDKLMPSAGYLPQIGMARVNRCKDIYQPDYFGGQGLGGGLLGNYQFYGGYSDQQFITEPITYQALTPIGASMIAKGAGAQLDDAGNPIVPPYRGFMSVGFTDTQHSDREGVWFQFAVGDGGGGAVTPYIRPDGFCWGESVSIGGISFEVSSFGDKLFSMQLPGYDFGGDADPAEVIYDLLTNKWGRGGLDPSKLDLASFASMSATLYAENHGYSAPITATTNIARAIADVLAQIDAALYEEPTTGLITLKLIRAEDASTAPAFDESSILDVTNFAWGSFKDTVNEVRVTYSDRSAEYKTGVAVQQAMANAVGNGNRRRSKTIDYPGITNAKLAGQVAGRDLNVLSQPLAKITLVLNRSAHRLRPGMIFKVSYAEYNISNMVFRCQRVDTGQLFSNKITVDAVQDGFSSNYQGQAQSWSILPFPPPYPIALRTILESPRWLNGDAASTGLITDPNLAHILPIFVANTNDSQYAIQSAQSQIIITKNGPQLFFFWQTDIPQSAFYTTFNMGDAYTIDQGNPYSSSFQILIQDVVGAYKQDLDGLGGLAQTHDMIAQHGNGLVLIYNPANGDHEFIGFESSAIAGGGQYYLIGLWRGLLDTPPIDITAECRGIFVEASMIGRRGWNKNKPLVIRAVPRATVVNGSGGDPQDTMATNFRACRPLPPANPTIGGEAIYGGVQGVPATTGRFKRATWAEEGIDIYGVYRERLNALIKRGDEGDDTMSPTSDLYYQPAARFATHVHVPGEDLDDATQLDHIDVWGNGLVSAAMGPISPLAPPALVLPGNQFDGYGAIDVVMDPFVTVETGDVLLGLGGMVVGTVLHSWQKAYVPITLPSWRNLLNNVRFTDGTKTGWTISGTDPTIGIGSFALSRGAAGHYMQPAATSLIAHQTVSVVNWIPRGLTAVFYGYTKNANSDANDTAQLTIKTQKGPPLFAQTGTSSDSASAPGVTTWLRRQLSFAIAALTQQIDVKVTSTEVAGGGSANADTCWDEMCLRVGQFQTTNGLTNGSFEAGNTSSWTNLTNSFVTATTIASPSANYAQGGVFSSSAIYQEFTLPAGWEYGCTLFAEIFMGSVLASDTATCKIEAMDGSSNVLASDTTGAQSFAELSTFHKFVVQVPCPDGATKVRVTLTATRTLGSGNSGAIFDEVYLWCSKDLAPRTKIALEFGTPTVQQNPNTWQAFTLAFPSKAYPIAPPKWIFGGTDFNSHELGWTDLAQTHAVGKCCGQFGGGVSSIDAYQFQRGSGAFAPHIAAIAQARYDIGNFPLSQSFTAAVMFRVDEVIGAGFTGACGLFGRMDLTAGWGLSLDASGKVVALMRGAGATSATVSAPTANRCDGGYHIAIMTFNATTKILTVYDDAGGVGASVSTAALGEITRNANTCHLRIGRDCDDHEVLPGQIARAMIWDAWYDSATVMQMWNYAKDPTARMTSYNRTDARVQSGPDDTNGATCHYLGVGQVAQAYDANLKVDGGSGIGLAIGAAISNLIQSWDFTDASNFAPTTPGTSVLTTGGMDASGMLKGVNVVAASSGDGITAKNIGLAASPGTVTVVCWIRQKTGTGIDVHLRTSAGVNVSTTTITPTIGVWQKCVIALTGWTGATATAWIDWRETSGGEFDLSHTIFVGQGPRVPALIPLAQVGGSDVSAYFDQTLPVQFNTEGELICTGIVTQTAPQIATGSIAYIANSVNDKNRRELQLLSTGGGTFRSAHYDGAAAAVNADYIATLATNIVWTARARWNRAGMLDNTSPQDFSAIGYLDSTSDPTFTAPNIVNGRTAIWTNDTTPDTRLRIGAGTAAPDDMILRRVVAQTREEKLI